MLIFPSCCSSSCSHALYRMSGGLDNWKTPHGWSDVSTSEFYKICNACNNMLFLTTRKDMLLAPFCQYFYLFSSITWPVLKNFNCTVLHDYKTVIALMYTFAKDNGDRSARWCLAIFCLKLGMPVDNIRTRIGYISFFGWVLQTL
jgi:hypothetical protein